MNFLSHFYFDRLSTDSNRVLGTILPDLVKNADKRWSLHPGKHKEHLELQPGMKSLFEGWNRHLEVDRHFHGSAFFAEHSTNIKLLILPILEKSPVRPSFLAHISLELLLDGLLITNGLIEVDELYAHLANADITSLNRFLTLNGIADTSVFMRFLDSFILSKYLHSYRETDQILYALNRICQRLWNNPFTEKEKAQLTAILLIYRKQLQHSYMDIFNEIDARLT